MDWGCRLPGKHRAAGDGFGGGRDEDLIFMWLSYALRWPCLHQSVVVRFIRMCVVCVVDCAFVLIARSLMHADCTDVSCYPVCIGCVSRSEWTVPVSGIGQSLFPGHGVFWHGLAVSDEV